MTDIRTQALIVALRMHARLPSLWNVPSIWRATFGLPPYRARR